ncbi:MAG: hypothetical protein HXY22_12035 [Alphaproteobacteria bacterium]|nr:hypothetical protein [Alphaproteobacteria bacterium]
MSVSLPRAALIVLAALLFTGAVVTGSAWSAETGAAPEDEAEGIPFKVTAQAEDLAKALEAAPSVGLPDAKGPVLYAVGFRSCPTCLAFKAGEQERLIAQGVDLRWVMYARRDHEGKPRSKPGERAMVAELWRTRDFALWQRWYAMEPAVFYETQPLPPSADTDPARMALVDQSRMLVEKLADIAEANGQELAIPALFWRDSKTGQWMGSIGYSEKTFPLVRDSLLGTAEAGH